MVCGVCSDEEEVKKVDGVAVVLKDYEERRTTDSLYLLILIATWVAMTILGIIASKDGDINRLIAPYNNQVSLRFIATIVCNSELSFFSFSLIFFLVNISGYCI